MKIFNTYIVVVDWDRLTLPIGGTHLPISVLETIVAKQGMLIWDSEGIQGLIPLEIIENAVEEHYSRRSCRGHYRDISLAPVAFEWGQTRRLLLDPRFLEKCHAEPSQTGTTGESNPE